MWPRTDTTARAAAMIAIVAATRLSKGSRACSACSCRSSSIDMIRSASGEATTVWHDNARKNSCGIVLHSRLWVKPVLVGQFEFVEWTPDHHLLHSRFMGLREDK